MMRLPVTTRVGGGLRFWLQWGGVVLRPIVRGVAGMSALWAQAWGLGATAVFGAVLLYPALASGPTYPGFFREIPGILIVLVAIAMAIGFACGSLFSILLSAFERGRALADLSAARISLWGFSAALPVGLILRPGNECICLECHTPNPLPHLILFGAMGSGCALATLLLARRARIDAPVP